ncbi:MAG: COX15/CtaA family protein [Anaerolineales bacterium]|nr:COX15/CtaA family protein [Anaerolineales bacterium]
MPRTQNRSVMRWLFLFAGLVAFLVVFGGFTRLTRSGLSIVEWNPVHGAFPPIGEEAWLREFELYKQTPEYQLVNKGMTLEAYKEIFYIEWFHRQIARFAGLFYAIPVFYFLFKGIIPRREFGIYFLMGMLFIGQAFMGWFMVASGLVDRPAVSHIRLTMHLFLALALFGMSLWVGLGHRFGFPAEGVQAKWSPLSKLAAGSMAVLLIQIAYGGFTAGLKAGHVSSTWPLMFGKLIPPGLFDSALHWIESPATVAFIHRWFAFAVLAAVLWLYFVARKAGYGQDILKGLLALIGLVILQITLGVLVVLFYVPISLALAHQAAALALFGLSVYFIHRLRAMDYARAHRT